MDDILIKSIADIAVNNYEKLNCDFVYYTDKETAFKIIKNKEIWMRKSNLMNDYKELEYGEEKVKNILQHDMHESLDCVLRKLNSNRIEYIKRKNVLWEKIKSNSFILSLTKENNFEKNDGRLSMWRAYGNQEGIAFVFKKDIFLNILEKIAAENSKNYFPSGRFLFPVYYDNYDDNDRINDDLKEIFSIGNIRETAGRDDVLNQIVMNICFSMMIIKHPGFREENEIRFWYSIMSDDGVEDGLDTINIDNEDLGGIYQRVSKIKLDKLFGLCDINWNELLKAVIIGPMMKERALALKEVLYDKIRCHDDAFEMNKIVLSSIPFRQSLR